MKKEITQHLQKFVAEHQRLGKLASTIALATGLLVLPTGEASANSKPEEADPNGQDTAALIMEESDDLGIENPNGAIFPSRNIGSPNSPLETSSELQTNPPVTPITIEITDGINVRNLDGTVDREFIRRTTEAIGYFEADETNNLVAGIWLVLADGNHIVNASVLNIRDEEARTLPEYTLIDGVATPVYEDNTTGSTPEGNDTTLPTEVPVTPETPIPSEEPTPETPPTPEEEEEISPNEGPTPDPNATPEGEIVTNLENVPTATLVANTDGIVEEHMVSHVENRAGQEVLVDTEGNVLAIRMINLEIDNEWWIPTDSSNGQYPINIYISAILSSLEPLRELEEVLPEGFAPMTSSGLPPNTVATVSFHNLENTGLEREHDLSWLPDWRAENGDQLHPVFGGETPPTGAEQIEGAIRYLQQLSGDQEITLPNGSIWNPENGINIFIKRTFSDQELEEMYATRTYNMTPDPRITIDESGILQIEILNFQNSATHATVDLARALSQISNFYGIELDGDNVDEELIAILISPDGIGGWALALDVGFIKENIQQDNQAIFDYFAR